MLHTLRNGRTQTLLQFGAEDRPRPMQAGFNASSDSPSGAGIECAHPCGRVRRRFSGRPATGPYLPDAPLAGLLAHQKGGFYFDGRFSNLPQVIDHYDGCMNLQRSDDEKAELVKYVLTL